MVLARHHPVDGFAVTALRTPAMLRILEAALLNAEASDVNATNQWRSSAPMAYPTFPEGQRREAVASGLRSEVQFQWFRPRIQRNETDYVRALKPKMRAPVFGSELPTALASRMCALGHKDVLLPASPKTQVAERRDSSSMTVNVRGHQRHVLQCVRVDQSVERTIHWKNVCVVL